MNEKSAEKRIEQIKTELQTIGEMRPGSLSKQYTKCGRSNCQCQDVESPKRHGPYYQLSYVHHGKSTSQFIQKEFLSTVMEQLENYKQFRALIDEWVELALNLARERLDCKKENLKKSRNR